LHAALDPLGVSIEAFFDFLGKSGLEQLFAEMPTTDVLLALRNQRNLHYHKPLEANDLNDQTFLAAAVPYCDIVVTEKQWVDLAHRKALDQKYQTKVVSDLTELLKLL
jgi:hypothetical protein